MAPPTRKRSSSSQSETKAERLPLCKELLGLKGRMHELMPKRGDAKPVAEASGVGADVISRIRSGETKNPQANTLVLIANACEVRPGWLLTGEPPKDASHSPLVAGLDLASDDVERLADALASRIQAGVPRGDGGRGSGTKRH